MERSIQIKISMGILLAAVLYLIILGVIYLIMGEFQVYHAAFTGLSWRELGHYNAKLQYLISTFLRLIGVLYVSSGIMFIGLIYSIYWEDSKVAWLSGALSTLLFVVITNIITYPIVSIYALPLFFANIVFLILLIIAWIITGKELLKKKDFKN